jgi:hypothetical protein
MKLTNSSIPTSLYSITISMYSYPFNNINTFIDGKEVGRVKNSELTVFAKKVVAGCDFTDV